MQIQLTDLSVNYGRTINKATELFLDLSEASEWQHKNQRLAAITATFIAHTDF